MIIYIYIYILNKSWKKLVGNDIAFYTIYTIYHLLPLLLKLGCAPAVFSSE
jgi:hypothetical protein